MRNIQTVSNEFLIREKPSRAWSRSAAPHRSSPHGGRTGGHGVRPPMLAAGKRVRRLGTLRLRSAPAEKSFLSWHHPLPVRQRRPGFGFAVHPRKLSPSPTAKRKNKTTPELLYTDFARAARKFLASCGQNLPRCGPVSVNVQQHYTGGHRLNKTPPRLASLRPGGLFC